MNNSIANSTFISSVDVSELIQTVYLDYLTAFIECAILGLLIYTTTLAIPQEMVYMWLSPKPFSIPNLLYAFTRYAIILDQALIFGSNIWTSVRWCIIWCNTQIVAITLEYVGVQGLLIARAYSLCEGNKVVTVILALLFMGGFISEISLSIIGENCQSSQSVCSSTLHPLFLVENICSVLTDLVDFGICLWKVWGTWKLKRETGIQTRNDLVSVILRQTVSRFSFVVIFSVTLTIIDEFNNIYAIDIVASIQNSLSAILIADFTLDLRQQNSAAIQAADIKLPTIQIGSIADYIHQSILVEMGDHETSVHMRVEDNDDLSTESPDVGIGSGDEASSAAA